MEAILPHPYAVRDSLCFLQALLGSLPLGEIAVRLWDGTVWKNSSRPRCTLVLKHPGALRRMFWPPGRIGISEAYLNGDFDVEGNLEEGVTLGDCLLDMRWGVVEKVRLARFLLSLPAAAAGRQEQSGRQAGRPLSCEDGFPIDFFRLWLGEDLFASCAYFAAPDEPLDKAQERELEYLCRKLGLKAGDRLLDLGCGWGSLIRHAAWRWGADAHGVTASRDQAAAADRLRGGKAAGPLPDRCRRSARPGIPSLLRQAGQHRHPQSASRGGSALTFRQGVATVAARRRVPLPGDLRQPVAIHAARVFPRPLSLSGGNYPPGDGSAAHR